MESIGGLWVWKEGWLNGEVGGGIEATIYPIGKTNDSFLASEAPKNLRIEWTPPLQNRNNETLLKLPLQLYLYLSMNSL